MMKVPKDLLDLQQWMGNILNRPLRNLGKHKLPYYDEKLTAEIENRVTPGPFLDAAQRMGIYNQQYWFRLFTLLQKDYPAIHRLFGSSDFNHLIAEPYLLKYSPDHWSLATLGSRLPLWIEEGYWEEDRDLVHQIALIEETHERLFYTYPLAPLTEEQLSSIADTPFFLQPTLALFALEADFFAFRSALLEKEVEYWTENKFPKLNGSKCFFILFPNGNELSYEEISHEEYLLLKAFEKGAKLEEALSLLSEEHSKVGEWFQKWAQRQWLSPCKAALHHDR